MAVLHPSLSFLLLLVWSSHALQSTLCLINTRRVVRTRTQLLSSSYGRNAQVWPPTNEAPVKLSDSFPNGEIPDAAKTTLQNIGASPEEPKPVTWRRRVPRAMARILRRAARAQEEGDTLASPTSSAMDKTPAVVAVALLLSGCVRPLDILLVSFLSGYVCILTRVASSVREDGVTPILPALPPQGHVPTLVSNPLGYVFGSSEAYSILLKTGVVVGLLAPVLLCVQYVLGHEWTAARACARPLFFLCVQAVSEAICRRVVTPLPIRIFVPVAYTTVRLGYLWNWTFCSCSLGAVGRAVAIANLVYWAVHLFGVLLPIGVLRYMRAHFFAIEAQQVTTRPGMEDSIGLSV